MYGFGIFKSIWLVLKHFVGTYLDDIKWWGKRYFNPEGVAYRSSPEMRGIFTVQYPEERVPVPEEFRFVPFLIYETKEDGTKVERCTSCGICAKVCPPQCIWIVRTSDPKTGRPIPAPAEFYIDMDICMNCGFCAEYCPFDAIKMDHDYELAVYDRHKNNIYDKEKLMKSLEYYASIRPVNFQREEEARLAAEAARTAARAAKAASL